MSQLCIEIHHRVIEIINEFIALGKGVQFDNVLQVLLSRYSLREWSQFGVGDYRAVPLVFVLFELSRKVNLFIFNYLSVRPIVALADLDTELTNYLWSFGLPPIKNVHADATEGPSTPQKPEYFHEYGLGPLHLQPLLLTVFYLPLNFAEMNAEREAEAASNENLQAEEKDSVKSMYGQAYNTYNVLAALSEYSAEHDTGHGFEAYLQHTWNLSSSSLLTVGIYCNESGLQDTIHTMKQIEKQAYYQQMAFYRQALGKLHLGQSQDEATQLEDGHEVDGGSSKRKERIAPLKEPKTPHLHHLLSTCRHHCLKENGFSPSRGQIRQFVYTYTTHLSQPSVGTSTRGKAEPDGEEEVQSQQQQKKKKSRKRKGQATSTSTPSLSTKQGKDEEISLEDVLEAAVEYLFLHLGNKRYAAYDLSAVLDDQQLAEHLHKTDDHEQSSEDEDEDDDEDEHADKIEQPEDQEVEDETASPEEPATDSIEKASSPSSPSSGMKDEEQGDNSVSRKEEQLSAPSTEQRTEVNDPTETAAEDQKEDDQDGQDGQDEEQESEETSPTLFLTPLPPPPPPSAFVEGKLRMSLDSQSLLSQGSDHIQVLSNEMLRPYFRHFKAIYAPPHNSTTRHLSQQEGLYAVGHQGEQFVFHLLSSVLYPTNAHHIHWLNQEKESQAGYDLVVEWQAMKTTRSQRGQPMLSLPKKTTFIEVKTTRFVENNVFTLSWWEWLFLMREPKVNYHIYRVFAIDSYEEIKIVVLKDVQALLQSGQVKLCLAV